MKNDLPQFIKLLFLLGAGFVLIMIFFIGPKYMGNDNDFELYKNQNLLSDTLPVVASESSPFKFKREMEEWKSIWTANEQSKRETYYSRRAYWGAPPIIPHPIEIDLNTPASKKSKKNACNNCHESGGFVKKFNAYTPITPHPEFVNCTQCHVPQLTKGTFKNSKITSSTKPRLQNKALISAPPLIPHPLQLRENCQACHVGPGAKLKIRTPHPERTHCIQCHLPQSTSETFVRKSETKDSFK